MKRFLIWLFCLAASLDTTAGIDPRLDNYARKVSSLIEPAKLATLGQRGANPRVQKYVALLAEAREGGIAPKKVAGRAVAAAGYKGAAAKLTAQAMLRNVTIAERLGCLSPGALSEMQKGQAGTVTRGPYRGQELSVDHIIPRAVVPELDNVIANLELMPLGLNEGKNAKVGLRQLDLGRKLHKAGLLSSEGLRRLEERRILHPGAHRERSEASFPPRPAKP